jgi:fido (protein-threonine AMPylation protein)
MSALTPLDKKHPAYPVLRKLEKHFGKPADPQDIFMLKDISAESWKLFNTLADKHLTRVHRQIFLQVYDQMEQWERDNVERVSNEE